MKNKKGQALLEFIIILPILIMILFIIIDFGNIMYEKNKLENISDDILELYEREKNIDNTDVYNVTNDKSIKYKINKNNNDYVEIIVYKNINIISPILKNIDDLSSISTKRIIYDE